jgi:hypothetical protein
MRKPSRETGQIPLLYRATCGIRIMRDGVFSVSSRDYMWTGERL